MKAILRYADGPETAVTLAEHVCEYGIRYTLPPIDGNCPAEIDFCVDAALAYEGEDGYFLIPQGDNNSDSFLMNFAGHPSVHYESGWNPLTVYGAKTARGCFLAAVTGLTFSYHLIAEEKDGVYRLFPRFFLSGEPYEAPEVLIIPLPDTADYCDMAAAYRDYLIKSGTVRPIAERKNDRLDYAAKSPLVRVRMAWKPVPSPVSEQTEENEPPIHVACSFDRLIEVMEECKRRGVERAEFCLVGWNKSGHDGRWPSPFPVEPLLGGEEGLIRAIARAKELGYRIACHTNSTCQYRIAEDFDFESTRRNAEGEAMRGGSWGGGQSYELCPQKALELAEKHLPRIAAYGFNGIHYIDVLSIVQPRSCTHPAHPLTPREGQKCWQEIARLSHRLFGSFSSEGGYDHLAGQNDYALYVSFRDFRTTDNYPAGCDRIIPFWQLVFHGITLDNPYCETVNPTAKGAKPHLKLIEYGGRPTFYIHSRFVVDTSGERSDWMGTVDLSCETEEDIRRAAACIKAGEEEYKRRAPLAECFMLRHTENADGSITVTYSNGATVTVDYETETSTVKTPEE